jgi:hypothetical protein
MTIYKLHSARTLLAAAIASTAASLCQTVDAAAFQFADSDWRLDVDTSLSYVAKWRAVDPDENKFRYRAGDDIITYNTKINSDDGSANFEQWDMFQNKLSALVDIDLGYNDYGIFARGKAFYDDVYSENTSHSRDDFLTYNSANIYGGDAGFQRFPNNTVETSESHIEWLDYFAYATWELPGSRLLDLRIGRQVINWGETTFTQGINGLQNRIDVPASNNAGVEVKEILLPTGSIYGQVDLTANITFEAYYQYEWLKTELDSVGSFYSTQDMLGPGAQNFLTAFGVDPDTGLPTFVQPVERTADNRPSDQGQFGTAIHWVTDGGTDFGFYFVNAHSKAPSFTLEYEGILPTSYHIQYFEDIQGYATSFTTVWGDTNVQGEVSYLVDAPAVDADGAPMEADFLRAQLGGSLVLSPNVLWDTASMSFELAATHLTSHDSDELRFDDFAALYSLRIEPQWNNVMQGLDMFMPVFWQHSVGGIVRESNIIEDAKTLNVTLKGVYLQRWITQLGYTTYLDGGADNLVTDRDNISLSVSYSF